MSSHTLDNRATAADAAMSTTTSPEGGSPTPAHPSEMPARPSAISEQGLLDAVAEAIEARCTCGCVHADPMAPADPRALAQALISAVRETCQGGSAGKGLPDII